MPKIIINHKILYLSISILISSKSFVYTPPPPPVTESYCKYMYIVCAYTISSARAFLFISDFQECKVFACRFLKHSWDSVLAKRPWDRKDFRDRREWDPKHEHKGSDEGPEPALDSSVERKVRNGNLYPFIFTVF